MKLLTFFLTLIIPLSFNSAFAKTVIKGNKRIGEKVILSYIKNNNTKENNKLEGITKDLYKTELFADIKVSLEKNDLLIEVIENPIVSVVKIVGNDDIDDDSILDELQLKKRSVFNKSKLGSDLKRINDIYIKSGRYLAPSAK